MASLKRKTVFDAGSSNSPTMYEINDLSGDVVTIPKSSRAITEKTPIVFSNKICTDYQRKLTIADGDRRPGTAA